MYRYIGNKTKLIPYILQETENLIGKEGTVADVMAGTGAVACAFKEAGYSVVASDVMTYSYHHLITKLKICKTPKFTKLISNNVVSKTSDDNYGSVISFLNNLQPIKGYFYKEFSPEGTPENGSTPRKYFSSSNAEKIDAIRETINTWKKAGYITKTEESILKHSLIMAVNEVANISGTYGYFLSTFKENSLKELTLKKEQIEPSNKKHIVKLGYAEEIAESIKADLCYIDPPYIKRQYAANYHILETIARGDFPIAVGKSGLRDWRDQYSNFCTKTKGLNSFETIIQNMNCKKFLISYSEDGLFTLAQLTDCFKKYGKVKVKEIDYSRFRSNNSNLPKKIKEYLISIEKE